MAGMGLTRRSGGVLSRLASPSFQSWASRFLLTRPIVRREGAAMFDIVAGFCHSQVLMAVIRLDLIPALESGVSLAGLSARVDVPIDRLEVLMNAARAIGLVRQRRGLWRPTMRGAALVAVPGLAQMIDHHDVLYRDLEDPVAFFRGETETELAQFWPYVFGAGAAQDPATAARYSRLMADSQRMVVEDTLATISFDGIKRLMDVGGGTGAFLRGVQKAYPTIAPVLFDLPAVVSDVHDIETRAGSFKDDLLPKGADAISLIRVLYDHDDDTVRDLLAKVRNALPRGGRIIISEPMGGNRAGDAYFAIYCMAMQTGRVRTAQNIAEMLQSLGYQSVRVLKSPRPYITSVVTAVTLT